MRPRKLRHRPSDELIDIRERGLPWLFSVFVVLFLLLTILLFYFIFTTRDIYLSQKKELEEDVRKKEAAAQIKDDDSEEETWKEEEEMRRRKKGKKEEKANVHVDIVPIMNRKTGEPDILNTNATLISGLETTAATTEEPTTTSTTTSTRTTTTTTTEEPTTSTTTTSTTTSTTTTTTTEEPTTTTDLESEESEEGDEEEEFPTIEEDSQESDETEDVILELEDDIDDVQVEEYEETTTTAPETTTTATTTTSTTTTTVPPETTVPLTTPSTVVPSTVSFTITPTVLSTVLSTTTPTVSPTIPSTISPTVSPTVPPTITSTVRPAVQNHTKISWDHRPIRSESKKFSKFGIVTQHEECSSIGRKIHEQGGNAIDAAIAAEFCISAVHPHSTGPGFGAVMLLHSRKKNGTYVIDGRERAPKNANQNTFVINPTIAHIGYSSMGVPGWISTLWTAFKQFGSGKVTWKTLVEPAVELLEKKRVRLDRLVGQAFESRKNHILHEKSFGNVFNQTTREGVELRNAEYVEFLKELSESVHAEHDFYGGKFAKSIVDEMKSRGGLINRHDLETYSCLVTRADTIEIGNTGKFLAGPHLPYHFPILGKVFQNITESFPLNPENILEYYVSFVQLLQKANQMKMFVGDDLFEPEVKLKLDEWKVPEDFKPEEQVEQNQRKRNRVPFSRILSVDEEGNVVNFMSTNTVPWGSVRRSPTMGFVWNNAMSSFDVFCRHDVNCVSGGKRPSVTNALPTILLNSEKQPELLLSPTSSPLETTAALVLQSTLMNMSPISSLDHPRIFPQSLDSVLVETGVPEELYRTLWSEFRAQFTHPTGPATLIHRNPDTLHVETVCDFRQNTRICYPNGD